MLLFVAINYLFQTVDALGQGISLILELTTHYLPNFLHKAPISHLIPEEETEEQRDDYKGNTKKRIHDNLFLCYTITVAEVGFEPTMRCL